MKKITLLILCILLSTQVLGIQIHQIVYNPSGADTGFEWIEVYNPKDTYVDISSYVLYKSRGQAGDPWEVAWNGTECVECIAQPHSYMLFGEEQINGSNLAILRLQNTKGALKLTNGTHTEIIGYGSAESDYFQEEPALAVSEGSSLIRVNNTENNAHDFIRGNANFTINTYQSDKYNPGVMITVENAAPIITSTIYEEGQITITLDDPNGYQDIDKLEIILLENPLALNQTIHLNCTISCTFQQNIYVSEQGVIEVRAYDNFGAYDIKNISVSAGPVLKFSVTGIQTIKGLPGKNIEQNVTLTNHGTVSIKLLAKTALTAQILLNNISLSPEEKEIVFLQPGEVIVVPLSVTIPYHTPAGVVTGELQLLGVED